MYTYKNIDHFDSEADFLLKFAEKSSKNLKNTKKSKLTTRTRTSTLSGPITNSTIYNSASNITFQLKHISKKIFNLIDVNSDNSIDWYDFGHFYQTMYLFGKFDSSLKGKLTAGELSEKFADYSEFPRVSSSLRHRSHRFKLLNQDTYVDAFSALVILRIDDLVALYTRKSDKSTLYEVEMKRIFAKAGLSSLNEGVLNRCLRGLDAMNIPKYDWECAFMAGIQENINYLESASLFNTAKMNNLTLSNTVFYNVDPVLGTNSFF